MTQRQPVSTLENIWFDSQQVSAQNMTVEQAHNDGAVTAVVNNHFGSGVLLNTLTPNILLNTDSVVGNLDGKPIVTATQPSDLINGVQLRLNMTNSAAFDRRAIKVAVFGLDFAGNLQYETFYFRNNEVQVSTKHFANVLSVLFNDMRGIVGTSFNLGGTLIIDEAPAFTISRDILGVAQDQSPNLFFRDLYLDPAYVTLGVLLSACCQGYDITSLNISTGYTQLRPLLSNDVTTQLGVKFQATTNNIQKITVLLAGGIWNQNPAPGAPQLTSTSNTFDDNLVLTLYQLQSSVSNSSQIVPQLAIDYDPSNIILAQISYSFNSLQATGITLDGYLQPVDFVLSNTTVGSGALTVGSYYAFTLKRSGATSEQFDFVMPTGQPTNSNTRDTLFNGTSWTDIPGETLWYRIYNDAAKITDGQGYDAGQGMVLPKTTSDPNTGATIDNIVRNIPFTTTQQYTAVMQAVLSQTNKQDNQTTGQPVFSKQQYVPKLSLMLDQTVTALQETTEPFIVGTIQDFNVKVLNSSQATLGGHPIPSSFLLYHFGIYKNKVLIKVDNNPLDGYNNVALVTALLNGSFTNAKFTVNTTPTSSPTYRVGSAQLFTEIYGDVDGDGTVTQEDASVAGSVLLGQSLVSSPTYQQYLVNTTPFVTSNVIQFTIDGYSGVGMLAPAAVALTDGYTASVATLNDIAFDFTSIPNITGYPIVLTDVSNPTNSGTFVIGSVIDLHTIAIEKTIVDDNYIRAFMRADVNSNFIIDLQDVNAISSYADGYSIGQPGNIVGTTFQIVELTLEEYDERYDDYYTGTAGNRNSILHQTPDLMTDDSSLASYNFVASPIPYTVVRQLTWQPSLVACTSNAKAVPATFSYLTSPPPPPLPPENGFVQYPVTTPVDPGRNDFFAPSNIVVGGQLVVPNGDYFKVDYEVGTIVLEIPPIDFAKEHTINIFTDCVSDFYGNGTTRLGYPAMRFADGTFIRNPSGLELNQCRFSVSLQSFYPNLAGISTDGYSGVIVDDTIGVYIDYTTGLLTLNFTHLQEDNILQTLNTKVQVTVLLKKAGFNNNVLLLNSTQLANILGLP
jgi:hypothetical protein